MTQTDMAAGGQIRGRMQASAMKSIRRGRRYAVASTGAALLIGAFSLLGTSESASASTIRPSPTLICDPNGHIPGPSPSIPGGTYGAIIVAGVCSVNQGHVVVTGDVTVRPGAALMASGKNDLNGLDTSGLTVDGNIDVESGGSLLVGCEADDVACIDAPNQKNPNLNAAETVKGSVIATDPLNVDLRFTTIGGDVIESGGGGGFNCAPYSIGKAESPANSDYEQNAIGGNLRLTGLTSCWDGAVSNKVGGSATFTDNALADPAASEMTGNQVAGNLLCSDNSPTIQFGSSPGSPNVLGGYATGQCAFSVEKPDPSTVLRKDGDPVSRPLTHISVPSATPQGYWLTARDGGVFSFGVPFLGSQANSVSQPVVGMAAVPGGSGYNLAGSGGAVSSYGTHASDCTGLPLTVPGGMPPVPHAVLNRPVVGIAAAPGGNGCWLAAADGGVFSFGANAPFFGSAGNIPLNQPVVGIAAAPDNDGYYLVAADGGVFAYGPGAPFHGSMGGQHLNQPVVGIAVDPSTGGYWMVAKDGGVFSFDAPFLGSMGGATLNQPVIGIAAAPTGNGYYLVAADGGIFAFGPGAPFQGSTGGLKPNEPVVGMSLGTTNRTPLTARITPTQTRVSDACRCRPIGE